jgi:hypothetical protein
VWSIQVIMGIALASFLIILGLAIVWLITQRIIDLSRLISEPTGDASMSRFQLLIFTFTVAFSFFVIVASSKPAKFPDVPNGVLALLGISAGSYVVSKGIQFSNQQGVEDRPPEVKVEPATVTYTKGDHKGVTAFEADVSRTDTTTVTWSIAPAIGSIKSSTGVYSPPDDASFPKSRETRVQVVATSTVNAKGEGKAEVVLINPEAPDPKPGASAEQEPKPVVVQPVAQPVQPVQPVQPIQG